MALTPKQQRFIDEYLIDCNATRAAQRAGYTGNENTLAVTGHDLLRNPKIADAIKTRLAETAMTADEVLMRLAEQARGSVGDFLAVGENGATVDLQSAALMGKLHLIHKLKTKTNAWVDKDDVPHNETTVEFELYNAQSALALLGKHHKLFTDVIESKSEVEMQLDEESRQLIGRIDSIKARLREGGADQGASADEAGEGAT